MRWLRNRSARKVGRFLTRVVLGGTLASCSALLDFEPVGDAGPPGDGPDASNGLDAPPCGATPCPLPLTGFSVCGRIYDLADTMPLGSAASLFGVEIYNALDFVQGATPETTATINGCGLFVATNVPPGLSLLLVSDVANNTYAPVATVFSARTGDVLTVPGMVVTNLLAQSWTDPFGSSLVAQGAVLTIFIDPTQAALGPFAGTPAVGVSPTDNSGGLQSFCFSDGDPLARTVPDYGGATATDGSCVSIGGNPFGMLTGTGGEPPGCNWPSVPYRYVPGVLQAQIMTATCP